MIANPRTSEFALLRERIGLPIGRLADQLGFSARTVYRWDRGEGRPRKIALDYLKRLANGVGVREADDPSFRFIDLFAGIGGLRRGFEALGGRCVYTCEWNRFARLTYAANHDCDHEIAGDVTAVSAGDVPEHDLLLAGDGLEPPVRGPRLRSILHPEDGSEPAEPPIRRARRRPSPTSTRCQTTSGPTFSPTP